ncbi:BnaA03g50890D [Brassica napus]|uniref:(rape) hypothetical protein n=1 Tax=Brassica napus TaxID=3708 RepID=A0A078IH02_BRANA|nr:unnamed protein product [Brassica napus]CDY49276.1 BnaA03g50890D [Brassica napus]
MVLVFFSYLLEGSVLKLGRGSQKSPTQMPQTDFVTWRTFDFWFTHSLIDPVMRCSCLSSVVKTCCS